MLEAGSLDQSVTWSCAWRHDAERSLYDVAITVLTLTVAVCAPAGRAGSLLSGGLGTDSESVTGDKSLGSSPWQYAHQQEGLVPCGVEVSAMTQSL